MQKQLAAIALCLLSPLLFAFRNPLAQQSPVTTRYNGSFTITVETDATTTGMASITYHFAISPGKATLTTSTVHEPIRCNGIYKTLEKNNVLELHYAGNESSCKMDRASYSIKYDKGKYYAKGLGGEGTYGAWLLLKRK